MSIVASGAVLGAFGVHWPGGHDSAGSSRIAAMPDDSGLAMLSPLATDGTRNHHQKKKAREHGWVVEASGGQVVIRPRATVPAASLTPVVPDAAVTSKVPAAEKTPRKPVNGHEVVTAGGPLPTAANAPVPVANTPSGLVRLSVRSAGVAPNDAGVQELQVKLGIDGGQPSDALPDTVTLHLRPQVPASVPENNPSLALKAQVDMVDAQRPTPNDPALRMRVRMTIAAAPTDTPMVQQPAGGDGKSNVIALTVALASFREPADDTGTPGHPAPGDGSSGPGAPAPGDPGPGEPAPSDPTPADPAPSDPGPVPAPSDPAPAPAPSDPAPTYPAPSDPAPSPAPSDPAPAPAPAPSDPAPAPAPGDPAPTPAPAEPSPAPAAPIEILLPVGPLRPVGGSTSVPVPPSTGDVALPDIPIDVIVEELPPVDPTPTDSADVPVTGVQEPAPEIPAPPAAEPDPGTAPDAATAPDTGGVPADAQVVGYTADAGTASSGAGT